MIFSEFPVLKVFSYHKFVIRTPVGGLCLLLDTCEYLWLTKCNKTTCVLKRSVTASRRFQNYQKRLITFGDTPSNVKFIFQSAKTRDFLWNYRCPLLGQSGSICRARNSNKKHSISSKCQLSVSCKITSRLTVYLQKLSTVFDNFGTYVKL